MLKNTRYAHLDTDTVVVTASSTLLKKQTNSNLFLVDYLYWIKSFSIADIALWGGWGAERTKLKFLLKTIIMFFF